MSSNISAASLTSAKVVDGDAKVQQDVMATCCCFTIS